MCDPSRQFNAWYQYKAELVAVIVSQSCSVVNFLSCNIRRCGNMCMLQAKQYNLDKVV